MTATERSRDRRRSEEADEWFLIDAPLFSHPTVEPNVKIQKQFSIVPKLNRTVSVFP
jgi:hypothetical protein